MAVHIALLRGINVGGNKMVPMAELRTALSKLGFSDVRTLLASGNVVLRGGRRTGVALETFLEAETAKLTGFKADYMVRTAVEWDAIVAANPFPEHAKDDPSHFQLHAFKTAPDAAAAKAFMAAHKGPEAVKIAGREAYVFYGPSIADSKFTLKPLNIPNTGRNWNTVLKLQALARS
jgi:uncharacterized protein (DUF1697 family)